MIKDNKPLSIEKMKELYLQKQNEKGFKIQERIVPRERNNKIPVSFLQQTQLDTIEWGLYDPKKNSVPNIYFAYTIKEKVNIPALHKSIQEILERHEILRTRYEIVDDEAYQIINDIPDKILNIIDLSNLMEGERNNETSRIAIKRSSDGFDVFNDSLMVMFTLIAFENENVLIFTIHHIASDADSNVILKNELFTLYQAFLHNLPCPFTKLPIQYADFSIAERKKITSDYLTEKLTYWKKNFLDGFNSRLPTDHEYPTKMLMTGDFLPIVIEPDLVEQVKMLSRKNRVSLYTILFSAYMSLFYCFSGYRYNKGFVIASQRTKSEIQSLIGCFADHQYVKVDFQGDPEFLEVIRRANNSLLDIRRNYIPFSIQTRHISSPPQIFFAFNPNPSSPSRQPLTKQIDRQIIPYRMPPPQKLISLNAISMHLFESIEVIGGFIAYQTEIYNPETIHCLVDSYIHLLTDIVNKPKIRISEMNIKPHKRNDE